MTFTTQEKFKLKMSSQSNTFVLPSSSSSLCIYTWATACKLFLCGVLMFTVRVWLKYSLGSWTETLTSCWTGWISTAMIEKPDPMRELFAAARTSSALPLIPSTLATLFMRQQQDCFQFVSPNFSDHGLSRLLAQCKTFLILIPFLTP